MKLKITQPGMESYTGFMGEVEFLNGESVDEVSKMQAQRIRSSFKVETIDGEDPGIVAQIARARAGESPIEYEEIPEKPESPKISLVREDLEAIADKKGLAGLRDFAAPYGVKSNSVVGLIDKLMELNTDSEA